MNIIKVNNYVITEPIINILNELKFVLSNGKLKDIRVGSSDITVTCPNDEHSGGKEKNPDCHINIDGSRKNVPYGYFHCFACNVKGSFIRFVQLCFGSSEEFAKKWLIDNYGVLSTESILIDDPISTIKEPKKYLDESILDQYQSWTPYLEKRKLSRDICEKFKVKYDPYHREVIFPIFDMHNRLKMLAKRSIDTKFFYMDKDQDKEVYGLNIIQKNNVKSCMLVEGPIDLLTCYTHGIPAIASLGVPSDYQIDLINNSCLNCIFIATDNDKYGDKFANIFMNRLNKRFIKIRIELPKSTKDVNDLTNEQWDSLIEKYGLKVYN